ncbi:MAG: protein translocase subunit SecF [Spirochaetes bacterium]|nr:MAG: protein translocase subunit SecF [Spirochaetota bacterium]
MFHNLKLKIIQYRKFTYILSLAIIISGLVNIAVHRGLKMGIDFAGGNMLQVEVKDENIGIKDIREILLSTGYGNNVQKVDDPKRNIFILKTKALPKDNEKVINKIKKALFDKLGAQNVEILSVNVVGPRISKYLLRTSYIIGIVAIGLILLYTTFRFKFRFGVAAIIALVHDVLVVLSFISFFGKEMDTYILAAILTIIGYSLNDTIVVFDRARENLRSTKAYDEYELTFNKSINQSLSRTIITSFTTLLSLFALYFFGGLILRNFAFAIIVGVIAGTYSSIFVASAIVVDWHRIKPEKMKKI